MKYVDPGQLGVGVLDVTIRIFVATLVAIFAGVSCAAHAIDKSKGKDIAESKLKELASSNYCAGFPVDVSALPAPVVESQGDDLLVDYKDAKQNVWIVVVVHPGGSAELSCTGIKD
ncbi:hypothetical protein [Rhodanobacter thiooxydans]|uniref:hypothetical protein n=1 Tax=Rhodanobacter thiooxydans TaxID=416169 RepID=UPI00131F3F85|nr:hypothetical protein [Rhodanobacter thiooxydans]